MHIQLKSLLCGEGREAGFREMHEMAPAIHSFTHANLDGGFLFRIRDVFIAKWWAENFRWKFPINYLETPGSQLKQAIEAFRESFIFPLQLKVNFMRKIWMTFKTPLTALASPSPRPQQAFLMSFFPFCEKLTHKKIVLEKTASRVVNMKMSKKPRFHGTLPGIMRRRRSASSGRKKRAQKSHFTMSMLSTLHRHRNY